MKHNWHVLVLMLTLVAPFWASKQALGAQTVGVHVLETAEDKAWRITVHPAAQPRPALKYRLLPGMLDRKPGNAAVMYNKLALRLAEPGRKKLLDKIHEWIDIEVPSAELPREDVRETLAKLRVVLDDLDLAARYEVCDWQLPLRERDPFSLLLDEVQSTRELARILFVQARLEILEGRFDEALRTLQTGYTLGRHVAEGPTLVSGLVGIAICHMMSRQVQDLIQQPDAPNLYWALTMLPRPLIDLRPAAEMEMNVLYLSFPELREVDDTTRTLPYWQHSIDRITERVDNIGGPGLGRLTLAFLAIKGYPTAKRWLIEQGRSPEEVEAMPVAQVAALYTVQTFEELRDETFKWFYVPYWHAREGSNAAERLLVQCQREQREIIPLASLLLPAVSAAQTAAARNDREIAVLRTIEALRLYAAAHEGRLPEKLSDLSVPVPVDPVTGQPFSYELRDDTAVIEGPPLPGIVLRVEIEIAR